MRAQVMVASASDIDPWLDLASELGTLFGQDMANDPAFLSVLQRNIARGSAFCARVDNEFAGAMLFRKGWIHWLGVRARFRHQGVGRALVEQAIKSGEPTIRVTTFGEGHPHCDAASARKFYTAMGFEFVNESNLLADDGTPRITMLLNMQ